MRLMVIGLDGATFRLLEPWMQAGLMPVLSQLAARSHRAILRSTVPPVTAPAWVSCFSGVNPGRHGIYNFVKPVFGWEDGVPHSSQDVRVPRLWQVLSDRELVTHVVDVPLTYPPEPLNGFMVSDLMVSGQRAARTYPETLQKSLVEELGQRFDWAIGDRLEVSEGYLRHLEETIDQKVLLDCWLIQRQHPDAFISVFQHTDVLSHYFWHVWDERHPQHEAALRRRLEPGIHRVIRRLDEGLEKLLEQTGPETVVAVVSDHGFGPARVRVHINDLLRRWGYLRFGGKEQAKLFLSERGLTVSALVGLIRRLDRFSLRRFLRLQTARRGVGLLGGVTPRPALAQSLAFFEHSLAPGIRLTPRGQARGGVLEDLAAELRRLEPPAGEGCVFEVIAPRENVYSGSAAQEAPELVVQLGEGYIPTREIVGGSGFSVSRVGQVSGFHRPEGIFLLSGPGAQVGSGAALAMEDVMPTLLAAMGMMVPAGLDGRVGRQALDEELWPLEGQAACDVPPMEVRERAAGHLEGEAFNEAEAEAIGARLRALGYQ